jgi:hypothetical protein
MHRPVLSARLPPDPAAAGWPVNSVTVVPIGRIGHRRRAQP